MKPPPCDVDWKHVIRGAIGGLIGRIGGHKDGRKGIVKGTVGGGFAPKNWMYIPSILAHSSISEALART